MIENLIALSFGEGLGEAAFVDVYKPAGSYKIELSASGGPESPIGAGSIKQLVSGMYFYQLKAADFIQTRKMLYLK